jgi:hypothetical protein
MHLCLVWPFTFFHLPSNRVQIFPFVHLNHAKFGPIEVADFVQLPIGRIENGRLPPVAAVDSAWRQQQPGQIIFEHSAVWPAVNGNHCQKVGADDGEDG